MYTPWSLRTRTIWLHNDVDGSSVDFSGIYPWYPGYRSWHGHHFLQSRWPKLNLKRWILVQSKHFIPMVLYRPLLEHHLFNRAETLCTWTIHNTQHSTQWTHWGTCRSNVAFSDIQYVDTGLRKYCGICLDIWQLLFHSYSLPHCNSIRATPLPVYMWGLRKVWLQFQSLIIVNSK